MINILARLIKRELSELQEKVDNFTGQPEEKAVCVGQMLAYKKVLNYIEDITGKNLSGGSTSTLNIFNSPDQKKEGLSLDDIIKSLGEGFKKMKERCFPGSSIKSGPGISGREACNKEIRRAKEITSTTPPPRASWGSVLISKPL